MTFNEVVTIILKHEGSEFHTSNLGYYQTKWGISDRTHAHIDIKNLTQDHAKDLHHDIWLDKKMPQIPASLRLIVYSFGTILGFSSAFRMLSMAVNLPFVVDELTPDLKAKLDSMDKGKIKAAFVTLLLFKLLDSYDFQKIGRSILPRLMESAIL
jgi:lysozyme family protein